MAKDLFNREITAGQSVIFPIRVINLNRDGYSYGNVIESSLDEVLVDTDEGKIWIKSKYIEIK